MKNIIVGTAGHIDHGKTSLVQALTGIDADRLAEEKRRGITIDLGFAHLQLTPGVRVGFIDVPGHERFVRNMLAGVGGIDLVMLVVASDESIQPQTREHFDICRLLGIRHGMVVLTKCDLVSPDWMELVQLEVDEFVAGSFLEGAPVVPVSARTGTGMEQLCAALAELAARIPARDKRGPARLPIDRAFSMRGFGTVVTGTLLSGALTRDQQWELLPPQRDLRVRGLQVYGTPTECTEAGSRAAVNLADISPDAIQRGMVLAEKSRFQATRIVDCSVQLLPSARKLKNRSPVHFHSGASQIEARLRLFGREFLNPGERAFGRLHLAEPVVLAPGDRFVLRQFSPVITIAGGAVVDILPARARRTREIAAHLEVLAGEDDTAKAALLIAESAYGLSSADLGRRLGMYPAQALTLARQARAVILDPGDWAVHRPWLDAQRARLLAEVRAFHGKTPLARGIPKHDLRARTLPRSPAPVFEAVLTGVADLVSEGDTVRHRAHRVHLNKDEESARNQIAGAFASAGLAVPAVAEVLAGTGMDATRGQALFRMLLKDGVLIRVSDDLVFHHAAIAKLKSELRARQNQPFTVALFKDWTGISRKYAVPLLEFLDREHVTARQGDQRTVL